MGKCPNRKVKKRRLSHKTARRTKFLVKGDDMVYDQLQKPEVDKNSLPLDEDLPGMGQYYCFHCDRYFANVTVRDEHFKTKRHKKRVKEMMGPAPHTQLDAELAAGMGMPDNGPKLMSL
ncbi:zinc finger protein [Tripterygium wilfordii]|uniref:Zinc finger protein n=1 Tax=Tripterygium wilfordii TaxID=458696 RepID=A0A7J7DP45_TRIWF|nr:zinc finger protein 593-like [Tripterygium wilfordii]KAF5747866.1 zinc finger protein [Tripterygium wilfordii]